MENLQNLTEAEIPTGVSEIPFEEYQKNKLTAANNLKGDLTGYDCSECLNRGYSIVFDGFYEKALECRCMPIRRAYWNIERSGLKNLMETYTFDNYTTAENWQKDLKELAISYLGEHNKWFFIGGQVGSGKTHLCTAIVGYMMNDGKAARYMLWTDTTVKLNACVNDDEEYDKLINPLKTAQILYIDDFFKTEQGKVPSGADVKRAFEILNYRYNNNLATLITSEKTISEILDIDEAVGSRISQKAKGYIKNLGQDKQKNYRLR